MYILSHFFAFTFNLLACETFLCLSSFAVYQCCNAIFFYSSIFLYIRIRTLLEIYTQNLSFPNRFYHSINFSYFFFSIKW